MNERIDHVAEAMRHREYAESPGPGDPTLATNWLLSAQVHATLALVEQQRIANLIALHRHEVKYDIGSCSRLYDTDHGPEAVLKPEIAEGLGLA